jgi:hypothetical protein
LFIPPLSWNASAASAMERIGTSRLPSRPCWWRSPRSRSSPKSRMPPKHVAATWLLAILLPTFTARTVIAQTASIQTDCDAVYRTRFGEWLTYLSHGLGEPRAPDPNSPCVDTERQAQADAVAAWSRLVGEDQPSNVSDMAESTQVDQVSPTTAAASVKDASDVALRLEDLPVGAYRTRSSERRVGAQGAVSQYDAFGRRSILDRVPLVVTCLVVTMSDGSRPPHFEEMLRRVDTGTRDAPREVPGPRIGEASHWFRAFDTDAEVAPNIYSAVFRVGNGAVMLQIWDERTGEGWAFLESIAQVIASRLTP